MRVIEWNLKSKNPDIKLCEDAIVVTQNYIAVIDGGTTKGKHLWNGVKSGKMAAIVLADNIPNMPIDLTAYELFQFLSNKLRDAYENEMEEDIIEERLRASIIIYSNFYKEIWSYGDCQCRIHGKEFKHKKQVDIMNSMLRSFVLQYYRSQNINKNGIEIENSEDVGRKEILPYLKMQFNFENKRTFWGYPVLNGDSIIPEFIKKYPVLPGDEFVLASDGYPIVCETLAMSEQNLKELLEEDPLCISKNIGTKGMKSGNISYDDRAYIRVITDNNEIYTNPTIYGNI